MTTNKPRTPHRKRRELIFFLLLTIFSVTLLADTEAAANAVRTGLALCATSAIPALFPFMVISELLVKSGISALLSKTLGGPFEKLFSLPRAAFPPFFLGLVCGFPIGTRAALTLYDEGCLSKKDLERLLTFCNIQSSAFLISAVGSSLYGNRQFGIFLYLSAVASSVLIGIVTAPRHTKRSVPKSRSHNSTPLDISTFTDAVTSSASGMLSICAYILFFSALIGSLSRLLAPLSLPNTLTAFLFGIFELTTGTSMAASIENPMFSASICAFLTGFGGISIGCQLLSFCRGRNLSLSPYFVCKLLQGIIMAFLAGIYVLFCPNFIKKGESISAFSVMVFSPKYIQIALIFFLSCLFLSACSRAHKQS